MAKRGILEHPKTLRLARKMGWEPWMAVGLLESLWQWCSRYAITGEITCDFEDVCDGIRYSGDPQKLRDVLIECRWLDVVDGGRLVVHDVRHHADNTWRQNLQDAGLVWWDGTPPRKHRGESTNPVQPAEADSRNSPETLQKDSRNLQETCKENSRKTPQPEPEPEPSECTPYGDALAAQVAPARDKSPPDPSEDNHIPRRIVRKAYAQAGLGEPNRRTLLAGMKAVADVRSKSPPPDDDDIVRVLAHCLRHWERFSWQAFAEQFERELARLRGDLPPPNGQRARGIAAQEEPKPSYYRQVTPPPDWGGLA